MSKKIDFSLDPRSIAKAITELEQYKRDVKRKTELLQQRVAELIASAASDGFASAIADVLLIKGGGTEQRNADVTVSVENDGEVSLVIAHGEDAVWVEFGTGVHFNGAVGASPHPKGSELGFTIGGYGKGLGAKQVWGFYEDGELRLTHGAPASMPMYHAMTSVCENIATIAKEVFAS